MLHIRLLGDFCLHDDDALITQVNTARLQALLAYLVLHRHAPQSRLHLASRFWPDSTEAQARTNLRHQLHLLRQALPQADGFLQADAHTLQWRPDAPFRLDVDEFESATARNASLMAMQEAIDAYCGELLPSCYDEWILPQRERLRQTYVEALGQFIGLLEQERDYAAAICYAQRLQRHDPLHEATYCRLMRLYTLNGDPAGVQRTYQDCVTVLQRELGVQPSPATKQACERLLHVDAPQAQRHNLPAQLTSFVGREEELVKMVQLLADPACRLLTIVGAGGIGKTRLAIEAARNQVEAYPHGVTLVSLTAASAPEYLVLAIADGLGFSFNGSQEPKAQLLNYLREKEMLIMLDNFEHLLAGVGLLVDILNTAPAVKLFVTSRERLKLPGEWVVELHGLAVPKVNDVARLEEYSAAQLFLQNTRRMRTDFSISAEDRQALVRLCQLVEGMPLGLELAAAWVHVLPFEEIVQELEQSLDLLTTSSQHVPERHRSIRAVFDHSHNLLTAEEQRVFRRLSVFHGGFRREAAQQVAGASLPSWRRWWINLCCAGTPLVTMRCTNSSGSMPPSNWRQSLRRRKPHKTVTAAITGSCASKSHGKNSQQQRAIAETKLEIDNRKALLCFAVSTREKPWLTPCTMGQSPRVRDALTGLATVGRHATPLFSFS